MDEKKKFEIEFEDDFDAWLEKHDAERQKEEYSRPVPMPPVKKAEPQPETRASRDVPISRRETVRNFKLNIDEEEYNKPIFEQPQSEEKKDKGIYFSNRQINKSQLNKSQLEHRKAHDAARRDTAVRQKQAAAVKQVQAQEQVDKLRRMLWIFAVVIVSLLCSLYGVSCINDVLALNRSNELILVTIEKEEGKELKYTDLINELGDSGLVKHEWFCKLLTGLRGFGDKTYINGLYYLSADMGVEGMLNEMRVNQTSDESIRLSFPEGWTIPQIVQKLAENNVCPADYIYAALREVEFEYGFVSDVPKSNERAFAFEGYMFPDTYDFFVSEKENGIGENPNSVIRKFLANFDAKWNDIYKKRAEELGLTMDEVITIASIIQKEAADQSQMSAISSVIHNRLNNRSSYPTLGCDSTKNYVTNYVKLALGDAGANAYLAGYDTNSIRSGLPAGPICNPGIDAIEAALNPDETNYYYFCHNNQGKIYFASNYSQFQANWAQVLKDNG